MTVWLGWLGRTTVDYEICKTKKAWAGKHAGFQDKPVILTMYDKRWESMTGIKLKPGELVKCKITKRDFAVGTDEHGSYVRKGFEFEMKRY